MIPSVVLAPRVPRLNPPLTACRRSSRFLPGNFPVGAGFPPFETVVREPERAFSEANCRLKSEGVSRWGRVGGRRGVGETRPDVGREERVTMKERANLQSMMNQGHLLFG